MPRIFRHLLILILGVFAPSRDASFALDPKILLIHADDVAEWIGPNVLADYVVEQMTEAQGEGRPFLTGHNELLPYDPPRHSSLIL